MQPGQTLDFSSLKTDSPRGAAWRGRKKTAPSGPSLRKLGHLPSEASRSGTACAHVGKALFPCGTRPRHRPQGHGLRVSTGPFRSLLLGPWTHRKGPTGKLPSTTFYLRATLQQSIGA